MTRSSNYFCLTLLTIRSKGHKIPVKLKARTLWPCRGRASSGDSALFYFPRGNLRVRCSRADMAQPGGATGRVAGATSGVAADFFSIWGQKDPIEGGRPPSNMPLAPLAGAECRRYSIQCVLVSRYWRNMSSPHTIGVADKS